MVVDARESKGSKSREAIAYLASAIEPELCGLPKLISMKYCPVDGSVVRICAGSSNDDVIWFPEASCSAMPIVSPEGLLATSVSFWPAVPLNE